MITAISINGLAIIGLLISLYKDKNKTIKALKVAGKTFINLLSITLIIIILVGFFNGLYHWKIIKKSEIKTHSNAQEGKEGGAEWAVE